MKALGKLNNILAIFVSLFLINSCADDGISNPTKTAQIEIEINRICDSIIQNTPLPGMLVGVWDKSLQLNHVKGYGFANIETKTAMNPEMLFRIGSNTKSFVITVLLQLVDEKKISLTDKLSIYYPEFPRADEVNLKMLTDMTSGIYNYTESDEFENALMTTPLKKWTIDDMLKIAEKHDYYFNPGTDIHYSNTNTALIGGIIEKIEGKSLTQVLNDRLLNKYNLKNTFFATDSKFPNSTFVSGYANFKDESKYVDDISETFDVSWAWAAGSMISNIYDVRTWVEKLVDGGMISDSLQIQRFDVTSMGSNIVQYGKGIFTYTGTDMWGHNGGLPGYTSIMMRHKTLDRTIVIFYNIQGVTTPDALFLRIEKLLTTF